MDLGTAVLTFTLLAVVLTLTPGLDTALVLRAAITQSRREALATGSGIVAGLFVWGAAAAAGVSALLTASQLAFDVLRYAGAAYLVALGAWLLVRSLRPRDEPRLDPDDVRTSIWRAARLGFGTNLLNPKVGVFYVALLPQFVPPGSDPLAVGLLLAGVHAALSLVWFGALIACAGAFHRWLRRPGAPRAIDGITGATLVVFGVRLAIAGR